MKTSTAIAIVVALVVVGGGAYWYYTGMQPTSLSNTVSVNDSSNEATSGQNDNTTTQTSEGIGDGSSVGENLVLGISSDATLGQYLNAYNGMTVYRYTKDTPGVSNCSGDCAVNWPPYTVPSTANINIPSSITGKVGTIVRADGSLQVTYNGVPLYFWKDDIKPNETTGEGVGGVWFVVKP